MCGKGYPSGQENAKVIIGSWVLRIEKPQTNLPSLLWKNATGLPYFLAGRFFTAVFALAFALAAGLAGLAPATVNSLTAKAFLIKASNSFMFTSAWGIRWWDQLGSFNHKTQGLYTQLKLFHGTFSSTFRIEPLSYRLFPKKCTIVQYQLGKMVASWGLSSASVYFLFLNIEILGIYH